MGTVAGLSGRGLQERCELVEFSGEMYVSIERQLSGAELRARGGISGGIW
ncbi:MAG: hypothetical protein ABSG43_01135 [Solirubrobacteraceae bacterium]|jgi:hypothetical protein